MTPTVVRQLVTAAIVLLTSAASAQDAWPTRPIKLLVTSAAGGGIDLMARITAEGMSRTLPQRVIVENNGTAGGLLAARAVARAEPDGYTFLFSGPGQASLPFVYKNRDTMFAPTLRPSRWSLAIHWSSSLIRTCRRAARLSSSPSPKPIPESTPSAQVASAAHPTFRSKPSSSRPASRWCTFRIAAADRRPPPCWAGQVDLVIDGLAPQLGNIREAGPRPWPDHYSTEPGGA